MADACPSVSPVCQIAEENKMNLIKIKIKIVSDSGIEWKQKRERGKYK